MNILHFPDKQKKYDVITHHSDQFNKEEVPGHSLLLLLEQVADGLLETFRSVHVHLLLLSIIVIRGGHKSVK